MATNLQPLLNPSAKKQTSSSSCKTVYVVISFLAILSLTGFLTLNLNTIYDKSGSLSTPRHICARAHNPNSCLALIAPLVGSGGGTLSEVELLKQFLNNSISSIGDVMKLTKSVVNQVNDLREKSALADCMELMDSSVDRVLDSISALSKNQQHFDAQTWLSSVLTNHVTCLDGLSASIRPKFESHLEDLIARARASLAILCATSCPSNDYMINKPLDGRFPLWVTTRDRRLLSTSLNAARNADVVVAKDGSGKYNTVNEAVAAAPTNSKNRYVIYIKKGTYKENVEIPKNKKNLMLTGDGMDLTIITGSLNVVDGSTTFNSATLIVGGDGFIAQDIWIQNTAGPQKHQAVALRVSADQSVINRCRLDAYQDTLYTHTLRQFYRDCSITGTVDFIFGNAAVVFQKCKLIPRKPMNGQGNMVTAQGRTDPNQNTGISIQNSDIIASSDLEPVKKSFRTYLGRPWKEYSRTVILQSNIGDVIDPAGWSPWDGEFALKTLYYGEYMNSGAGAGTSQRVKWAGYHVITSAAEANKFTVASMIQGGVWLKSTGVSYTEGL
ncbi:Pectinesterase/pectinesterase inhibitor [Thalictrum thalictroides]|uniref:Pectinesterase n=1 Tax=Thalictrum thalictroides TaxID=46969 RepID=A0A7J6VFH9_THATH|nr:Pectinesterase/pectinesterase inhibitor [Thalictrum thalictroides]